MEFEMTYKKVLIIGILGVFIALIVYGLIAYVGYHFIAKYW